MNEVIERRPSVFASLGLWFRRVFGTVPAELPPPPGVAAPPPPMFQILLAALDKDSELAQSQKVFEALDAHDGLKVRVLKTPVAIDEPGGPQQLVAANVKARHLLAEDETADLLIWGEVTDEGPVLRFATPSLSDDDQPGGFGPQMRFSVPEFTEPAAALLRGLALSAMQPHNEPQRNAQRSFLPTEQMVAASLAKPSVSWSMPQQMLALFGLAQIQARLAELEAGDWFAKAAETYDAALKRLPRDHDPLDEAMIRRQLGNLLVAQSDKQDDPVPALELAAAEYRQLAELLPRANFPLEWGMAQNRLGMCLYRVDLQTGRIEVLKEALVAFQSALSAFPRTDARFADSLNNLAQGLQVYGDQMKSPDVLFRAIETCRQALEVRVREKSPAAWAGTLNTLGSALFLHDKHKGTSENLEEAATVLKEAVELYQSLGMGRLAQVALKNLAHVDRLSKERQQRKVADPGWWQTDEPAAAPEEKPADKE